MIDFLPPTERYDDQVQAVIALLDDEYTAKVKQVWEFLHTECQLAPVDPSHFPHFTFHIAESYAAGQLDARMRALTAKLPPCRVQTNGLGIFTGVAPVVYMPLIARQRMLELHRTVWHETAPLGKKVSSYYQPDRWMPHITLAHEALSAEDAGCVVGKLTGLEGFFWEIEIRQLAFVTMESEEVKVKAVYSLEG